MAFRIGMEIVLNPSVLGALGFILPASNTIFDKRGGGSRQYIPNGICPSSGTTDFFDSYKG
jgi:hypothetical protein